MKNYKFKNGMEMGFDKPTFIVAEVGQNHNGDINIAKRLIDICAVAKVNAVKFTKRDLGWELTKEMYNMPYINENSFGETYGEHREFLELSKEEYIELYKYTYDKGLLPFVTACDPPSVDIFEEIGNEVYKIASRDLTNLPLIEYIAKLNKPMILSTGMATYEDIDEAVNIISKYHDKYAILHCTSEYPTKVEDVNLRVIPTLIKKYNTLIGLSDHTPGILTAALSIPLGAKIIEKHITLSRAMKGTDQAASLEPEGVMKLVKYIRDAEKALGRSEKVFIEGAKYARQKLERSLVSKRVIKKGDILREEDLILKSPGTGLRWRERNKLIGKKAKIDINEDVILKLEWFE